MIKVNELKPEHLTIVLRTDFEKLVKRVEDAEIRFKDLTDAGKSLLKENRELSGAAMCLRHDLDAAENMIEGLTKSNEALKIGATLDKNTIEGLENKVHNHEKLNISLTEANDEQITIIRKLRDDVESLKSVKNVDESTVQHYQVLDKCNEQLLQDLELANDRGNILNSRICAKNQKIEGMRAAHDKRESDLSEQLENAEKELKDFRELQRTAKLIFDIR